MRIVIGLCLVLAPFAVVTGLMIAMIGILPTLVIYASVAVVITMIMVGVYLITEALRTRGGEQGRGK